MIIPITSPSLTMAGFVKATTFMVIVLPIFVVGKIDSTGYTASGNTGFTGNTGNANTGNTWSNSELTDSAMSNPESTGYEGSNPLACHSGIRPFNPHLHKRTYRVGVHAIRGFENAFEEYDKLFSGYLSMTAGRRFDPPINFEMVPMDNQDIFDAVENEEVDFIFANPSIFSCIGTEDGVSELATITMRLDVRGHSYDLDVFGGVIVTREDNDDINTIGDLKDKIIGAGDISLLSTQLQFYEMEMAGMSSVMAPKQVVFTKDENKVVSGVLSGEFDVGFVRTDTIERTQDANGKLLDPDDFKILQPKIFVMEDGTLFPFLHSTPIFPESPFAVLTTVPKDVAVEAQDAILAIGDHASVARALKQCQAEFDEKTCDSLSFPLDFDPDARCDTTKEIAAVALEASIAGSFSGFRPTLSYFELRSMQQAANFITRDDRGNWHCTRAATVYDGIVCPAGFFKRGRVEFEKTCGVNGVPCGEGYDCFCKPCIEAFDVDVYPFNEGPDEVDFHLTEYLGDVLKGCDKMSLCASIEQTKKQTFRIYDNLERAGAEMVVRMHVGRETKELQVSRVANITWAAEFTISEPRIGVAVLEILFDGKQIPESPFRVQIMDRDCTTDYGEDSRRVPSEDGACVCGNGTMFLADHCVSSVIFFVLLATLVLAVTFEIGYIFMAYKKKQGDYVWLVNVDDLHFNEPLEIIGQGAFGVVLLAEYKGTKVAVKRVLPQKQERNESRTRSSSHERVNSRDSEAKSLNSSADDIEAPKKNSPREANKKEKGHTKPKGKFSNENVGNKSSQSASLIDILGEGSYGSKGHNKGCFATLCNCFVESDKEAHFRTSVLGTNEVKSSWGTMSRTIFFSWLPRCDKKGKEQAKFVEEMRLLSRLRHPCITTVMGAVISPIHAPMLVMEYMEYGSLYDLLRNETMYTGGEIILQILRDIAQGMRYLHSSKPSILHGDLKARNILVDSRFRAKVADFGLSQKKKHGIQGTPLWLAPEYLRGKTDYNATCDIYSLSIIFYEIYARQDPYEGEDFKEVLRRVCDPRTNKRPPIPETCPPKMVDVMKKCWSPDPFFRPTSKDLDLIFLDMTILDAEPIKKAEKKFQARPTGEALYDLFPKHISSALKAGEKVEPESHDMVTVVFTDIVGFEGISESFPAEKVSNMLDRLYLCFDGLARKHNVFKVETVGDNYMGVANLAGIQEKDHVKHVAELALSMVDAASKVLIDEDDPKRGYVQIRAGFDSGPVISNVIGTLNPRFGLFGDTVNNASRMEAHSESGRVLCTERAALLLKQQAADIPVIKRGKIGVQGKGSMKTYWVGNSTGNVGKGDSKQNKSITFAD